MPQYMLIFYADEKNVENKAARQAEFPLWAEVNKSLREAGLLVANGQLSPVDSATTVHIRDGRTELTDGPFAITKEYLAGYYVLDCADLDEALKYAARMPLARFGWIEVRPIMAGGATPPPRPRNP
jgi:hypothetical protein